ncbi:MAG: ROK family protein, partial [Marmoricola sp.]
AEARFGAARETADALMVTLGTGIGGSLVVGGRLIRGVNGMAGEYGHMQVVPDGRHCECGGRGCWEQYCSGRALARAAAEGGSTLSGPALTIAAREGDPAAAAAYAEVGRWLGVGLANLAAALDPPLIVIGGGVSAARDLLLDPARKALEGSLVGTGHRELPEVVGAVLGPMAGVVGAADLARVASRPSRVGRWGRAPSRVARGRARRR